MSEDILRQLSDQIKKTGDFSMEQLPEIVMQSFNYYKFSQWLLCFFMTFLFLSLLTFAFYFYIYPKFDQYKCMTLATVFGRIMPLVASPLCIMGMCNSINNLLEIYIAPKYVILGFIKKLL